MDYYLLHNFYPNDNEQFTGFTINVDNAEPHFILDKSVKIFDFDFFKSMDNYFIGSGELCEVLIRYNPTIRLIPCKGLFANHHPLAKPYFIIDYSQTLDAMDYQYSEYSGKPLALARLANGETPPLIRSIKKLLVKQELDKDLHYFFVKNTLLLQPVISQTLLDALLTTPLKIAVEKIS